MFSSKSGRESEQELISKIELERWFQHRQRYRDIERERWLEGEKETTTKKGRDRDGKSERD